MILAKVVVFILTFLAYAGLHSLRQGWSYSKPQLKNDVKVDRNYLGMVDTLYLISYSLGMATIGNISKKIPLNIFIGVGMILAAICYMSFSIDYQITGQFSYTLVTVMMCLNGFFQSTGWPGVIGIMGNWFGKGKTGVLMGIWAINANVGNIIAELLCNLLQDHKVSWTYNFIVTGVFCCVIAIFVIALLRQKPSQTLPVSEDSENSMIQSETSELNDRLQVNTSQNKKKLLQNQIQNNIQPPERNRNVNIFTALCLPRVPYYVVGYACLKGCIYGLLFWLPQYLDSKAPHLGDQKGYISSMLDIGSFIGGLAIGLLSDRYSYRALFLSPLLLISAGIMFMVSYAFTDVAWMYYAALFAIGITIGGPYNIIGTVITIDLGQQTGGANITAVSSLIEGSAAIFAAGSQYIISILPFQTIFYLFCGECILASLALLPLFCQQLSHWRHERRVSSHQN